MKMKRILSMLAATTLLASSVAVMGVSADDTTTTAGSGTATYNIEDATVDVDLLPKADAEWKQISANDENLSTEDVVYTTNPEIPTVTVEATDTGALRIKMTKEVNKEVRLWYDAQCDLNLTNVSIAGKYLYYDFKAVGQWNMNLYLSGEGKAQDNAIKLACYIMANKYDDSKILYTKNASGDKSKHSYGYDEDGTAGSYQGRLNLEEIIKGAIEGGAVQESRLPATLLKDGGVVDLYRVGFWVVGATSANLTINRFFLGNDPSDPTVAPVTAAPTEAETTTTTAGTNTANTTKSDAPTNDNNTTTIVIVVVIVVVVVAAVVAGVVVSKKKKK